MTAPDPKILAEAIKRSEADMQLFRGIDDPEIKKLVEFCEVILVAAKAYGPMREALKKAEMDRGQLRLAASTLAAFASDPALSGCTTAFGVFMRRDAAVEYAKAVIRSTLNPKDPSHE